MGLSNVFHKIVNGWSMNWFFALILISPIVIGLALGSIGAGKIAKRNADYKAKFNNTLFNCKDPLSGKSYKYYGSQIRERYILSDIRWSVEIEPGLIIEIRNDFRCEYNYPEPPIYKE